MAILWYIFVCFPYMLQQATNSVSLDKIDVFSYPNDCYSAWFGKTKFGLKMYFFVFSWFLVQCVGQKYGCSALYRKP